MLGNLCYLVFLSVKWEIRIADQKSVIKNSCYIEASGRDQYVITGQYTVPILITLYMVFTCILKEG